VYNLFSIVIIVLSLVASEVAAVVVEAPAVVAPRALGTLAIIAARVPRREHPALAVKWDGVLLSHAFASLPSLAGTSKTKETMAFG